MKSLEISYILIVGLLVAIVSSQDESIAEEEVEVEAMKMVAKANVKFSRSLYTMLKQSSNDDNLVFSPHSLNILLEMVRRGTNGSTNREIMETLGLTGLPESTITEGYSEYIQSFPEFDDIEFETAERVYVPFTHRIRPKYQNVLNEAFQAAEGVKGMDFAQPPATSVQKINTWISENTNGKIDSVLTEEMVVPSTKLFLVSGVYFNGLWDRAFVASNREIDVFYTNDTHNSYVTMLNTVGRFKYAEIPIMNSEAVAIPYAGERLEMIIVLPKDRNGLDWPLSAKLNNMSLSSIPARMKKTNLKLSIPLFEMETYLSFSNTGPMLQKMGLRSALSPESSNFGGISPNSGLYIDRVIQKTVFKMTEQGLQSPEEEPIKYKLGREPRPFRANHPFLAYVFDTETKSVLLMAKKVK